MLQRKKCSNQKIKEDKSGLKFNSHQNPSVQVLILKFGSSGPISPSPIVHCSEGAPKWSLELKPSRARGGIEIRNVIPEKKIIKNCWVGKDLKSSSLPVQSRKLLVRSALTAMEMQSAKMTTNREDITSFHTCGGSNMP